MVYYRCHALFSVKQDWLRNWQAQAQPAAGREIEVNKVAEILKNHVALVYGASGALAGPFQRRLLARA
jgi:hypothetical protein